MNIELAGILIVAVIAFVAGLLVGRRNPKVADVAAGLADKAKDAAQDAAKKV